MPWIDSSMCTGCTVCVQNCPADAIKIHEQKAVIDQTICIRCGICHDVCPLDAARHDSELISSEINANMVWIAKLRAHPHYANAPEKQKQLIKRLKNHFNKKIKVNQQTIERLDAY